MNQVIPGGFLGNIPVPFLVELGILGMEWEGTRNDTRESTEAHYLNIPGSFLVHSWDSWDSLRIPQESTRNWWGSVKSSKHSTKKKDF